MQILALGRNYNSNFEGRVIPKGKWTPNLMESINSNDELKKLAAGEYDIIAKLSRRFAGRNEYHFKGEPLYKLALIARKSNESLSEKLKNLFKPSKSLAVMQNYHTEQGTMSIMSARINAERYKRALGI